MKKRKKRRFVNYIIISITLVIMIYLLIEEYKEMQIENGNTQNYSVDLTKMYISDQIEENKIQQINIEENKVEENKIQENEIKISDEETNEMKEYPKENIITKYKGYQVTAKLEIPKINLKTYVLKKYSIEALKVSVTKFWGAEPNQIGNFCVAGHNFINKNMFSNLKKLDIGDKFTVSDNTIGKVEYEIYDIYTVLPNDVNCLSQETNNKREVTLITCTTNSKKRIIVKAREAGG